MQDRLHKRINNTKAWLAFLLGLLLAVAGPAGANASDHTMHMSSHGRNPKTMVTDVARDPSDVPAPIGNRPAAVVHVTLTAKEVVGVLDASSGTTYRYWTFDGKVPGPMIRVRQGDTVEVTLQNDPGSQMVHSIDLHAALGPGGGAAFTQVEPGKSKTFSFKATAPGLFVYHCGTPMIAEHIANGMFGMILVEPPGGLPHVDHEYYLMQSEFYTMSQKGKAGLQQFSAAKLMDEQPEYFVFNGTVDALTKNHPMKANAGDTVRIFFGDAGPNETSSLHGVGEIFTREYALGSLTSPPLTGIQTASVPPGGAAVLELKATTPGQFAFMDHAMSRMAKGLLATMVVSGQQQGPSLMSKGPAASANVARLSGVTPADVTEAANPTPASISVTKEMAGMTMPSPAGTSVAKKAAAVSTASEQNSTVALNGCMNLLDDGRVMLRAIGTGKIYRMEAQPFLFSQNANRLVHVTGRWGSVVAKEDPNIPSFVVDTVDELAPNCSVKLSAASIRKVLAKNEAAQKATVGMTDMSFYPATLTVNVGQTVTWKNSSGVTHNVVDDAGKALYRTDVKLPAGVKPFASSLLHPDESFSRTFTVPGIYRYVCTLHESSGMKGTIIVRGLPAQEQASNRTSSDQGALQ